jgi:chaperone LolA
MPAAAGDDAADIIRHMEKKYHTIDDITVVFRQTIHYGVTGTEQSFSGVMYTKKGNKYRIELEDQTIVTDGSSVWSYSKSNNQVIVDRYKEGPDSFSPDRIMVDVPARYSSIVLGHERVGSSETTIMKLTPKEAKANLQWMKVWVDDDEYLMRKIQALDVSDNLTTYLLDSLALNQSLGEGKFRFDAPPKAELIDLR